MRFHDEELFDNQDKTGWKFIHGYVFQYPYYKSLFAAAAGSGTQLFPLYVHALKLFALYSLIWLNYLKIIDYFMLHHQSQIIYLDITSFLVL